MLFWGDGALPMPPDPRKRNTPHSGQPNPHGSHIRHPSSQTEETQRICKLGSRHSAPTVVEKASSILGNLGQDASHSTKQWRKAPQLTTNPPPALPEPPLGRPLPPPSPLPAHRINSPRLEMDPEGSKGQTTRTDVIAIAVLALLVGGMLVLLVSRITEQ